MFSFWIFIWSDSNDIYNVGKNAFVLTFLKKSTVFTQTDKFFFFYKNQIDK